MLSDSIHTYRKEDGAEVEDDRNRNCKCKLSSRLHPPASQIDTEVER